MALSEKLTIQEDRDIFFVRQSVRQFAKEIGMSLIEETKIVTAASEITRNILNYAREGFLIIELITAESRQGVRLTFEDSGPGIENIELAMKDGYTTGTGLGLGLSGSKRLVNEFEIYSEIGKGTKIILTQWKR